MSSAYRVASPFLIRLAGVPFDVLEQLAAPKASAAAREFIAASAQLESLKPAADQFIRRRDNGLSPDEFHAWKQAVKRNDVAASIPRELADYAAASTRVAAATRELDRVLADELTETRRALQQSAAEILPRYLLFASAGAQHLFVSPEDAVGARNNRARERERHLYLYLQRVAAKNDTFSEFGPSAWGKIVSAEAPLTFSAAPGISRRHAFLERWTAHVITAGLNADPAVFDELAPIANPNGLLVGNRFVFADGAPAVELNEGETELVARADGQRAVHSLGRENVLSLCGRHVLVCGVQVPAFATNATDAFAEDVANWRDNETRNRWAAALSQINAVPNKLVAAATHEERAGIVAATREHFAKLGVDRAANRALYAATNPIAEECARDCTFEISEKMVDELATDAAAWFDLWRDTYAFVAGRVAANLRGLLEKAPVKDGAIPLPAFLRFCEAANIPLAGPGLVGMAMFAFAEVKAAFAARLARHIDQPEYELTLNDCHVVRNGFEFPRFDEYTFPSADLQVAAESAEAIARGDYTWIVSELHPPVATLHHCMYWSCPDHAALSRALAATTFGKPSMHFGFFAADFTGHTALRNFDALPDLTNFVSAQRGDVKWRRVPPALAEVYVEETTGDVAVRHAETKEVLGSFARAWLIPLGFHPFQFTMAPHTPRLRCGKVIVQRRTWTVRHIDFEAGNFTGVSRDLVVAIERLRAQRDLPRFVYIRPTEQALRRAGAVGRDKDTKPVFIDLENYIALEVFHRWLVKAGELDVTEMLPAPNDLLWREPDGRRTFEMRTLIVPRT